MRRASVGRYRDQTSASQPGELPREGDAGRGHQRIKHGAVDDPNPALEGDRQRVAINVKTDALENEYAYGRISEAAYRAARLYGRVLELASGSPSGGGQWAEGDRVDAARANEKRIVSAIERARKSSAMVQDALPILGLLASQVLRMALIDRMTMAEIALRCAGRAERMDVSFYAETFRQGCEQLAKHWQGSSAPLAKA